MISSRIVKWKILVLFPVFFNVVLSADGNWGEWTDWESCSVSCGKGNRKRYRWCNNPPPSNRGAFCMGKAREITECDAPFNCPVDGGWGAWSLWTACSVSCGEGVMHRFRDCDSPEPANGGRLCSGSPQETMTCFAVKDCPRDGKWSSWSRWSSCSVTCGDNGSTFRYRACNNPPPVADGRPCDGSRQQQRRCRAQERCSVNGQWSEWSEWSSCSVTCGSGVRSRVRRCSNPPPQNGGLDCSIDDAGHLQERSCNGSIIFCPVDGGWSDWSDWGECNTPDCKTPRSLSYRFRDRSCSNPHPAHKGSMCQGTFLHAGICEGPVNCAVDGEWSEWSAWTCTKFVGFRKRTCDSPPPSNGGKACKGDAEERYIFDEDPFSEVCPNVGNPDNAEIVGDDEDWNASGSGSGLVADAEEDD